VPEPAPEPLLRDVRWWDVEALVGLERELFGLDAWTAPTWWGELAQTGPGGSRSYLLAHVPGRDRASSDSAGGAAADGEIAGYAGVSVNGPDADVMTVAVAPGHRGTGLGARLLGLLIDSARAAGASQLLLEVRADNLPAQRLYLGAGFERIAVRRGYYRTPEGPVDAWIMRRRPLTVPRR
jgi:[ribosomal protein S18]-alanine N-acetyltransferase